ncbi:hypothetical protein [Candidatus Chlamydia corallus]|uniref:hypothetical protein n=1 Tax=Candidatus Chlamydia corallus TaxID=2038470 RepID=UPI001EFD76F8|nr:hypothetical protein [Candidatus Chlamydia corallus]
MVGRSETYYGEVHAFSCKNGIMKDLGTLGGGGGGKITKSCWFIATDNVTDCCCGKS